MTTRREKYVAALMPLLQADPGLQQLKVKVERSIFAAISAGDPRVLVVHRGGETVESENIGVVTRRCIVMVSAVVRDEAPDRAADDLFELVVPIVLAYDDDDLISIDEIGTDEPQSADDEGGIGVITMRFAFTYQTQARQLS
ncbi:hypothetical protein [Burkholderia gladioli]|uniref:hypothetical protein n=1 Tax=Burkholderia gladioli TaxID=28095 RepID=UPI001641F82F|nr:hypothetical protein [Burkholderia gladioli]